MGPRVGSRTVRALTVLVAMVALAAAACGGGSQRGSGDPGSGGHALDDADRSAELRFALNYGFNGLDPHRSPSALADAIWMRPVYDSLLTVEDGPEGVELAPRLATSFDMSDDGQSVTFELRDDVTFQDGTPFDADAVRANIERAQDPESTVSSSLESVEEVEVVDDTHVVLRLNRPDPGIPWVMATETVGMMVSPGAFDSDLSTEPVGSGPFRLVSATKDADAVYERWDGHWDPDAALAQRLTISTILDGTARYNGLRSGEYDAAYMTSPYDVEARSLESEGFQYDLSHSNLAYGVMINAEEAPFDDVRVRRAVSMALDRSEISEQLTQGISPPTFQPFNEGYLGYDESIEDPYDPDEARRLVAEAGAEGATVDIIQQASAPADALAQVVQQSLGDIGLDVELTPLSPTEARPAFVGGGHHGLVAAISGRPDPGQTLALSYLGRDNPAGPSRELTRLANDALAFPLDSPERERAYQEISAYLTENPVHVPIVQFSAVVVASSEVVGADNLIIGGGINTLDFRRVGLSG